MTPKNVTVASITSTPQSHETEHVHTVYDQIASHFSSTRYKPWPIIAQFLDPLPTGWVGLDAGTGNGKYLPLPLDRPGKLWTIGLDRSRNLLEIARTAGEHGVVREVVWGDVLGDVWRHGVFDYAISIATIHHLATPERRKIAIQRLLSSVNPKHGRVLVYVWAIEQDELSKRAIPSEGELPAPSKAGQDVFVPWVLTQPAMKKDKKSSAPAPEDPPPAPPQVFNRYYHMFAEGELSEMATAAAVEMGLQVGRKEDATRPGKGVEFAQNGWERSNYYVELRCWEIAEQT